ncbi:MAG TPA: hypothetical protein VGK99_05245 [Acidobacteriota bacterium]|jgi:hypothetical protein
MSKLHIVLLILFPALSLNVRADEETKLPAPVQPRLTSVFPMSAQPGARLEVELRGEFLDRVNRVLFETGDLSGAVLSSTFTSARIQIHVAAGAQPGARYFRLLSQRGASNLVLFRVSRWPVPLESEPNDELDSPTVVSLPVLINARLSSMNDVDLFRFHAKNGERIQFNVLGARNWTPADVSLAILWPNGREIVHDEGRFIWDPYIDHMFEKEGDYLAAVTVTRMPAGGQSRNDLNYQLAIGRSPFIWSLFPFGGAKGSTVEVEMLADFVPTSPVVIFSEKRIDARVQAGIRNNCCKILTAIAPDATAGIHELLLAENSGILAPAKFAVGDFPECLEVEPNDSARVAQTLSFPATVNGRIDRNGDEDWYRISAETGQALTFIIDAEKYGSVLDSQLTLLDTGGRRLASNDDAKWPGRPLNRDPLLTYRFKEKGDYFVKVSSPYQRGDPDHVYRLTVRPQQPGFVVSLNSDRAVVARGGSGKLGISVVRQEGFEGDVRIDVEGLPAGVTAKPLIIPKEKDSDSLVVEAAEGSDQPLSEIEVFGAAAIGGNEIRRRAWLPPSRFQGSGPGFSDYTPRKPLLSVVDAPWFSLESAASTVYLVRGGKAEFGVKITRRPEFTAPLEISSENLPAGVTIDQVDFIDEGRMARITLTATESTPQARIPDLVVVGKSREKKESAPRISLQVD